MCNYMCAGCFYQYNLLIQFKKEERLHLFDVFMIRFDADLLHLGFYPKETDDV